MIRLDMGTNRTEKTGPALQLHGCVGVSAGARLSRAVLVHAVSPLEPAGISSAQHFSVCLPTALRSHARSAPACPVTNVS